MGHLSPFVSESLLLASTSTVLLDFGFADELVDIFTKISPVRRISVLWVTEKAQSLPLSGCYQQKASLSLLFTFVEAVDFG